jgi:hypothetical protein
MAPDENCFYSFLKAYQKFGEYPDQCGPGDLPGLMEYQQNLRKQVSAGLADAETLLSEMDPGVRDAGDFHSTMMVAYSLANAMERVLTLSNIGAGVSMAIEQIERDQPESGPRKKSGKAAPSPGNE